MAVMLFQPQKGYGEDRWKQRMNKSLVLKQFGGASVTHPHFTELEPEPEEYEAFSPALTASWCWSRARVGISETLGDSHRRHILKLLGASYFMEQ